VISFCTRLRRLVRALAIFAPPSVSGGWPSSAWDRRPRVQLTISKLSGGWPAQGSGGTVVVVVKSVVCVVGTVEVLVDGGPSTVVLVEVVAVVGAVLVVVLVEGMQPSSQHGSTPFWTISASGGVIAAPATIMGGLVRYSRRLRSPAVSVPATVICPDACRTLLANG
jgi:hypothetical protein